MTRNRLLVTGIVGFLAAMLGCVTPALIALLAALGISGSMGWLDYVLLPAMATFAALVVYAVICGRRRRRAPISN
jgi:mercuric ion transport protein